MKVPKDALKYAVVVTAIDIFGLNNVIIGCILYKDDFPVVFEFFANYQNLVADLCRMTFLNE